MSDTLSWNFNLNSWIIQDGNYPDFCVGQIAEFAVEFWVPEGGTAEPSLDMLSVSELESGIYNVIADVVLATDDIIVLDIGILVYCEPPSSLTSRFAEGSRVAVPLGLGVDPYFYFERLGKIAGIPPLVYSWKVSSIQMQTAPLIEGIAQTGSLTGQKVFARDWQQRGYEDIARTDAWNDDDGHAEYLLRCNLLDIPPKRDSITAT